MPVIKGGATMKPIRIGLAGVGRAGWGMHCEELTGHEERFAIVAACDLIPSRREKIAARYGCRTYETFEELIADPEVELIDIATRSHDHVEHGLMALDAGKYVFMEKPMACTHKDALRLLETAERYPGKLFIRHNRRFDPDFLMVQEVIASGILGTVYQIKLCRHNYQRRDDWQTLAAYGGGQLLNWGPHIVDHALRLLESPVAGLWSELKQVAAAGDCEDHVKVVLKGVNGRLVDLEISGGVTQPSPLYTVYGTKGTMTLTDEEYRLRYLDPAVELAAKAADPGTPGETFGTPEILAWREETLPVRPARSFNIWQELYAAVREGSSFPISLEEAAEVMRGISRVKEQNAV